MEWRGVDLRVRETAAGHWLPPETLGEARSFVAATAARGQSGVEA